MSELTTRFVDNTYVEYYNTGKHELAQIYLKSEADKVIAHQKYRRCMAMAYVEWLKQMTLCYNTESILYRRAYRRERKWKEMAKKFKPNT